MNSSLTIARLRASDGLTEKGRTTFEWKHSNGSQSTVYYRKVGQICGGHYHEGTDASKNPELMLLISGRVKVRTIDCEGIENDYVIDASEGPVSVSMPPLMLHYFAALTSIIYLDYRLTVFDKSNPDTHNAEEFYRKVCKKK